MHHSLVSWKITPLYFFRSNITKKGQSNCKLFETFECSDQNSPNSCKFWKNKSGFSLNLFYQSLVPSNIIPLYFLSLRIICFGQKQPIKVQIFEIFECSDQNLLNSSSQFWTSQFLFKLCIFFTVITRNSPVNFKFQLLSALVKICQILHVIFQTTSQFFIKFCITL